MSTPQPQITKPLPAAGRFVTFALRPDADADDALRRVGEAHDGRTIVGIGVPLLAHVARALPGLRPFPDDLAPYPSTQHALWVFLAHPDRSAAFDAGRSLAEQLGGGFRVVEEVDSFAYRRNRDLSGFEDGTENPKGKAAVAAAIVQRRPRARWRELRRGAALGARSRRARGHAAACAGPRDRPPAQGQPGDRRRAALRAHQRTAQESFDPPAFVLRRSMPYGGIAEHGLYFVAYGESLDRFERQLRRMAGRDDGIVDSVTSFSRAVTGGYYLCPPIARERLDTRALRAS